MVDAIFSTVVVAESTKCLSSTQAFSCRWYSPKEPRTMRTLDAAQAGPRLVFDTSDPKPVNASCGRHPKIEFNEERYPSSRNLRAYLRQQTPLAPHLRQGMIQGHESTPNISSDICAESFRSP